MKKTWAVALWAVTAWGAPVPVVSRSVELHSTLSQMRVVLDAQSPGLSRIVTVDGQAGGLIVLGLDAGVAQTLAQPQYRFIDAHQLQDAWWFSGSAQGSNAVGFHRLQSGLLATVSAGGPILPLLGPLAVGVNRDAGITLAVETTPGTLQYFSVLMNGPAISTVSRGTTMLPAPIDSMISEDSKERLWLALQGLGIGHLTGGSFSLTLPSDAGPGIQLAFYDSVTAPVLLVATPGTATLQVFAVGAGSLQLLGSFSVEGVTNIRSVAVFRHALPGFPLGLLAVNSMVSASAGSVVLARWEDVAAAVPGVPVDVSTDGGFVLDAGSADAGADAGVRDSGSASGGGGGSGSMVNPPGSEPSPKPSCSSIPVFAFGGLAAIWVLRRRKEWP